MSLPTKVLIATPIHSGLVTTEYMLSVRSAEMALNRRGIATEIRFIMGTILHMQRNVLLNMILIREEFSHVLFIDSDMEFRPQAVEKLIDCGKPFVGCLYPSRHLSYGDFFAEAKAASSAEEALSASLSFVASNQLHIEKSGDGYRYVVDSGLIRTYHLGCGITLIHRSVTETMRDMCPDLVLKKRVPDYVAYLGDHDVLRAFDPITLVDGSPLGEDLSFCARWIDRCNGEVWALVDEEIGHVGRSVFRGTALDHLLKHPPRPKT